MTRTREPVHLRVFISSPGDVGEERRHAFALLGELTRRPVFRGRATIEAVVWDDPVAPVPMDAGVSPQASVNRHVKRPSACDLTIVILWARLGSPTSVDGQAYDSGTAFEHQDAHAAGKPVWIFRRSQEPSYKGARDAVNQQIDQFEALGRYLEALRTQDGGRAFVNAYADSAAFRDLLAGQLEAWLTQELDEREALEKRPVRASEPPPPAAGAQGPLPYNLPARGRALFVGRERELSGLRRPDGARGLRLIAVTGPSGVGKSELCIEHARARSADYPGGVYYVRFPASGPPTDLAALASTRLGAAALAGMKLDEQCQAALSALGSERCLLVYDNVPNEEAILPWLPPATGACDLLVSTTFDDFSQRWERMPVEPLDRDQALALVRSVGGDAVADGYGAELVDHAVGLPVELCPLSLGVRKQLERGRPVKLGDLSKEAEQSFAALWNLLDARVRTVLEVAALFVPERIPEQDLAALLRGHAGFDAGELERALGTAMDYRALQPAGGADAAFKLHALFHAFVRSASRNGTTLGDGVLAAHGDAFSGHAKAHAENPGTHGLANLFGSYPAEVEFWRQLPAAVFERLDPWSVGRALYEQGRFSDARTWYEALSTRCEQPDTKGRVDRHQLGSTRYAIGWCLYQAGSFAEARAWFGSAVDESEKGDVDGRVDHELLGCALHQTGMCLYQAGSFAEARPWFERAAKESEKGDVRGRMDHDSLGVTLYSIGMCLCEAGSFAEAQPWFERAAKESEKGDVDGRVNHAELGKALHQVGMCLHQAGSFAEARALFDRATKELGQGDVHGRVDHEVLGRTLHVIGQSCDASGDWVSARSYFARAVEQARLGDIYGRVNSATVQLCVESLERVEQLLHDASDPPS